MVQPLWRTIWVFLKKVEIELSYDPVTPLLGIYLEKNIIQNNSCTTMFIADFFTIARTIILNEVTQRKTNIMISFICGI